MYLHRGVEQAVSTTQVTRSSDRHLHVDDIVPPNETVLHDRKILGHLIVTNAHALLVTPREVRTNIEINVARIYHSNQFAMIVHTMSLLQNH